MVFERGGATRRNPTMKEVMHDGTTRVGFRHSGKKATQKSKTAPEIDSMNNLGMPIRRDSLVSRDRPRNAHQGAGGIVPGTALEPDGVR